jgi:hypothetical protein
VSSERLRDMIWMSNVALYRSFFTLLSRIGTIIIKKSRDILYKQKIFYFQLQSRNFGVRQTWQRINGYIHNCGISWKFPKRHKNFDNLLWLFLIFLFIAICLKTLSIAHSEKEKSRARWSQYIELTAGMLMV